MSKITGNGKFSQLYQKMAEQRGGDRNISGGRKVTVAGDLTLDTARVSWSGASQKRASEQIFAAMKREYGDATATRVFQNVVGNVADQRPIVSLDKLKQLKHELAYEKTAHQGDPSSRVAMTFSDVYHGVRKIREEHGLSGDKHLRFKSAKGLYFHSASLGSATGIGNLLSGERPIDKRQAAGKRIWMSLANQFGDNTANRIFGNVFGNDVLNDDGPRVSVSLDQFDQIAQEVAKTDPKAIYAPIADDVRSHALTRLKYLQLPKTALNETFERVRVDSTQSKLDNQALQDYLQTGKENLRKDRIMDSVPNDEREIDWSKEEPIDLDDDTTDAISIPWRKESARELRFSMPKNSFDEFSDRLVPSALPKPRTDYQRQTDRLYHDNPAVAMQALGDLTYVIESADKLGIDEDQLRNIKDLRAAALAALGIARKAGDETHYDKEVSAKDHATLVVLCQIASLVRNAREGTVTLTSGTLDDFRQLIMDIGAQFQTRLKQEDAKFSRLKELGADLRELGTGRRDQVERDPDLRRQRRNLADREPLEFVEDGLLEPPNNAPLKFAQSAPFGAPSKQTPLQTWHESRVQLKVLNSKIWVVSGHDLADVKKYANEERHKANAAIHQLNQDLNAPKKELSNEERNEILATIDRYEGDIRRANWAELNAGNNLKRLCQEMSIDPDDMEARRQKLTELSNQHQQLEKVVQNNQVNYMEDPLTQKMADQYADLGFQPDVDYLDGDAHFNTPMLQARAVHTMQAAVSDAIPGLLHAMDELDQDD